MTSPYAAGKTLREAGEYLQRDQSAVSRFESAEYPVRRGDVTALLDLYGVSSERDRTALLQLSEDMWQKGWWDEYVDAVDHRFVDFAWLEAADRVERFQRAYDRLWKTALGPEKSSELLSAAMEESRDTPNGTDP